MDFSEIMKEWINLKVTLANARQDLKQLNSREKELKQRITMHMAANEIDTVNVKDKVKVNLKKKTTRGAITKQVIRTGLLNFFNGDGARVDQAIEAIESAQPTKDISSVSVVGLKNN
jgi:seryl-tRNA synthetase